MYTINDASALSRKRALLEDVVGPNQKIIYSSTAAVEQSPKNTCLLLFGHVSSFIYLHHFLIISGNSLWHTLVQYSA